MPGEWFWASWSPSMSIYLIYFVSSSFLFLMTFFPLCLFVDMSHCHLRFYLPIDFRLHCTASPFSPPHKVCHVSSVAPHFITFTYSSITLQIDIFLVTSNSCSLSSLLELLYRTNYLLFPISSLMSLQLDLFPLPLPPIRTSGQREK